MGSLLCTRDSFLPIYHASAKSANCYAHFAFAIAIENACNAMPFG